MLSCNGYQVYVPLQYLMGAQARLCPAPSDRETTREESEEVAKPGARKPIPAEGNGETEAIRAPEPRDRKAVMERISSENELFGRVYAYKGLDHLIQAAESLAELARANRSLLIGARASRTKMAAAGPSRSAPAPILPAARSASAPTRASRRCPMATCCAPRAPVRCRW